ncbi:unnamed protein product [Schistosoma intercalatum]|nr:unnamed protein product [Schistosoma intercalatum]
MSRSTGRTPAFSIQPCPGQSFPAPSSSYSSFFISVSISRHDVSFGLPLFRFFSGFQVGACPVMQFDDLRNICPIHFHRLFLKSSSAGTWFVLSRRKLLLMVSGQWMLSILHSQLLINTCTYLMMVVVVLQIVAPYSRTVLKFVLKILTLILVESCFEFHIFFNCRNAAFTLPTCAFSSPSDLPRSSMMPLTKYVKYSTSSKVSLSIVVELMFSMLYLRI